MLAQREELTREAECIHVVGDGLVRCIYERLFSIINAFELQGHWRRFELNGVWNHRDNNNCASNAPKVQNPFGFHETTLTLSQGCMLYRNLQKLGMPLIRMGWSALAANTKLKPHFGMSNGQLKVNLPVICSVPANPILEPFIVSAVALRIKSAW